MVFPFGACTTFGLRACYKGESKRLGFCQLCKFVITNISIYKCFVIVNISVQKSSLSVLLLINSFTNVCSSKNLLVFSTWS